MTNQEKMEQAKMVLSEDELEMVTGGEEVTIWTKDKYPNAKYKIMQDVWIDDGWGRKLAFVCQIRYDEAEQAYYYEVGIENTGFYGWFREDRIYSEP